jgi:hypothetical protein
VPITAAITLPSTLANSLPTDVRPGGD